MGSQIPGISHLLNKDSADRLRDTILLLKGPPGSGKTAYCRAFLAGGLQEGAKCIYINSSLTEKQFRNQFGSLSDISKENLKFLNPVLYETARQSRAFGIGELAPLNTILH